MHSSNHALLYTFFDLGSIAYQPEAGTASRSIIRLEWFFNFSAFGELGIHQLEEEWKQFFARASTKREQFVIHIKRRSPDEGALP